MRYKVGDRVKYVKKIIHHNVVTGGIFKITYIDGNNQSFQYLAESKKGNKQWFKEEELQKVEYTYEDLQKSPIGTKITFEDGVILTKTEEDFYENDVFYRNNENLEALKDNINLGKIIKIEEPEYQTVYESKLEILDEVEKRYLRNIIRPFRNRVKAISLITSGGKGYCYINIELKDENIYLPNFEINTMYKGMKPEKEYGLEELGI